jgi:hypothetical protein
MRVDLKELEDRLWTAADSFQVNAGLRPSEYSRPVLGLPGGAVSGIQPVELLLHEFIASMSC